MSSLKVARVPVLMSTALSLKPDLTTMHRKVDSVQAEHATRDGMALEQMDRQAWAIRPITNDAPNTGNSTDTREALAEDNYRLGRRDSAMSTYVVVNHFEDMDMSNWAFGPIYCP